MIDQQPAEIKGSAQTYQGANNKGKAASGEIRQETPENHTSSRDEIRPSRNDIPIHDRIVLRLEPDSEIAACLACRAVQLFEGDKISTLLSVGMSTRIKLTTYPSTKAYHLHLDKIRAKVFQVILTGGAFPAFTTRSIDSSHSSLLKNQARVVYGVSGRKRAVASPTGTVMHYTNRQSSITSKEKGAHLTPQTIYNHLHPANPPWPSKFS